MHRHRTLRTTHRARVRVATYLTDNAGWLVPALWIASGGCLVADLTVAAVEFGHASIWLALLAIAVNSYVLVRHIISRLTRIIALWQEDVHTGGPPNGDDGTNGNIHPLVRRRS